MSRLMIHPTASISPHAYVGLGTKVWHHSQVCDGARIGRDCIVGSNVYIDRDVTVGERVKIQTGVQLYRGVEVEDGVFLGPLACLANDRYPRAITPEGRLKADADWVQGRVHIGYGASIGAGAVVLPDVTVGKFAMVGAGAVVVEDVPDYGLVLGVPGRLCGYVCACGHRLAGYDASSGEAGWCPLCGVSYRFVPDAPPGLDDSKLQNNGGDSSRPVSAETKKIA